MVSGFFTSPCDHDRIFSGDASEMRMALKFRGFLGFSKRLNKSSIIGSLSCGPAFGELDVEREALELLHHDVEGLRPPGLEDVLAFDDRLVHAGATRHIVRLDGEHLLQRVGRAVRLEGPDLHLPEPLAAELCLTAERLLRDQRVRTGRARVDLVVDQMVELHHVHDAHRHLVGEGFAGPSVVEPRLAGGGQRGPRHELEDLLLRRAVEHGRTHMDALRRLLGELHDVVVGKRVDEVGELLRGVELLQLLAQRLDVRPPVVLEVGLDLVSELARRPAEVGLEDLTNVHAARDAERVQHDVDRRPVGEVRHVLLGQDARQHALVAVAPGHLVADLELALDGDEDLDHLDDAGRELVPALQPLDLLVEDHLDEVDLLLHPLDQPRELVLDALVADLDVAPVVRGDLREDLGRDLDALLEQDLASVVGETRRRHLALEQLEHLLAGALPDDPDLVLLVLPELGDLVLLDGTRPLVLLDAFSREHAGVDDRALDARRDAEARVPHLARLLAEDRAQELLLGRQLGLALRGDLADQDIARLHLRADADDPRLVEVLQRLVADVRDVARDLFGTELGVTRDALELLDVDRREEVVLHDALGDEDRVLEVVAAPRHEGDQHVAPERQLAHLRRRTVGDHVSRLHVVAHDHDRTLVDAGVLVRPLVLDEVVDVDAGVAPVLRRAVGLHDDTRRVDLLDDTIAARDHRDPRVARDHAL